MKALSVRQPWANMIASGEKTIETRTWATKHRGELLIVSTKRPQIEPAGFAVAVVEIVECRPMDESDWQVACCDPYPNAFGWILTDVRRIDPFPVKGSLGLYNVDVSEKIDPYNRRS